MVEPLSDVPLASERISVTASEASSDAPMASAAIEVAVITPEASPLTVVTFVAVVIVPAVMFVVLANVAFGNVTVPLALAASLSMFLTFTSGMPAVAGVETAVPFQAKLFPSEN